MKIDVNKQNQYRGEFITGFAKLERAIDLYLAMYFTGDNSEKINNLIDIIIDRIPFGDKRSALKLLIDQKDDEDFKTGKHGNKKINHKAILEDIRKFAVIRNHFAHYGIVHRPLAQNVAIQLTQHRDGSSIIEYTIDEFNDIISNMEKRRLELIVLRHESFGHSL